MRVASERASAIDGLGVEFGRSVVLRFGVSVGCEERVDDIVQFLMQFFIEAAV